MCGPGWAGGLPGRYGNVWLLCGKDRIMKTLSDGRSRKEREVEELVKSMCARMEEIAGRMHECGTVMLKKGPVGLEAEEMVIVRRAMGDVMLGGRLMRDGLKSMMEVYTVWWDRKERSEGGKVETGCVAGEEEDGEVVSGGEPDVEHGTGGQACGGE